MDGSGAEQEVAKLKEKLEKKEVNLKFDTTKMKTQMEELQKVLNNAFKLKSDQLNNLKQIQNTLKEINSLSKDVQKNLFGSGSTNTSTGNKELDNSLAKYRTLRKEAESLQKQMSKTVNVQSYEALNRKLSEVTNKMTETSTQIDKLKNGSKRDISRSIIDSFYKIQQNADATSKQIDNIFKNKNLTNNQLSQLTKLKAQIESIKNTSLSGILSDEDANGTLDMAYTQMHNLYMEINNVNSALKGMNTSVSFTDKVNSSISQLDSLKSKLV